MLRLKEKEIATTAPIYRCGIIGEFNTNGDYSKVSNNINQKIRQILKYCSDYKVPVKIYIDYAAPNLVKNTIAMIAANSSNVAINYFRKEAAKNMTPGDLLGVTPAQWVSQNCDSCLVLHQKETELDLDSETCAFFYYEYPLKRPLDKRITLDPNAEVRRLKSRKKRGSGNDYVYFRHEPLVQPVDAYEEYKNLIPDVRDPYDRDIQ